MMNLDLPENLPQSLYPLAWLVGEFKGDGFVEGVFGLNESEQKTETKFKVNEKEECLEYSSKVFVNDSLFYSEVGSFRINKTRPPALVDPQLFPVDVEIIASFTDANEINNELKETFRTKYVGVIGKGKLELISDEIELLNPELKFGEQVFNDLWRSKKMFGWVAGKVYWVWELAFLSTEGMNAFVSGRISKD